MKVALSKLLEDVRNYYATIERYEDRGQILFADAPMHDAWNHAVTFRTRFVRGCEFEFDFHRNFSYGEPMDPYRSCVDVRIRSSSDGLLAEGADLYQCDGKSGSTTKFTGISTPATLRAALVEVGVESEGASCIIPRLLLPNDVQGRCILDLDEGAQQSDEVIAAENCYHVAGQQGAYLVDLWISRSNQLIRRVMRGPLNKERTVSVDYHTDVR